MNGHLTRRQFLLGAGTGMLAAAFPWRLALADAPTSKRLLVIIQRGAMDGLGAVAPYGDAAYHSARGDAALGPDDLLAIDRDFAFNKALSALLPLYQSREMLVMHAVATPYRERSHFEAQDLLENGSASPHALSTGWLNRALALLPEKSPGLAIGPTVPLVMTGPAAVTSWSPAKLPEADADFLGRIIEMYAGDPLLSKALGESETYAQMAGPGGKDGGKRQAFSLMMAQAARFMASPAGPRIGTIDIGGWDTHTNQKGRLGAALAMLAEGIVAFRQGMGEAWSDTAVVVMTEFGRTVRGNGSGGTDHGTASTAFLFGGKVAGGRIAGDWPGLGKLYQDRDLIPANDLRSLQKAVLAQHLGIAEEALSASVFPGSAQVQPTRGLFSA